MHLELPDVTFRLSHIVQNWTRCQGQTTQEDKSNCKNGGRKTGNKASCKALRNNRKPKGKTNYPINESQQREELEEAIILEQTRYCTDDLKPISNGIKP